jgi:hypothetical protein
MRNVEESTATLRRFFAATTVDEMAKEVRHPEITLPRMKAWYAGGVPAETVEFTVEWSEQDNYRGKGVNFIFTALTLGPEKTRDVALEVPADGSSPKLDWEHFISWSEVPWSEFLRTTSERPADFRVTLTPIDYYNKPARAASPTGPIPSPTKASPMSS